MHARAQPDSSSCSTQSPTRRPHLALQNNGPDQWSLLVLAYYFRETLGDIMQLDYRTSREVLQQLSDEEDAKRSAEKSNKGKPLPPRLHGSFLHRGPAIDLTVDTPADPSAAGPSGLSAPPALEDSCPIGANTPAKKPRTK